MGINLADIVTSEPRTLEDFSGHVLAIDAFNTLYQFLAIIRQPDGTPLMDHEGRDVTSVRNHLPRLELRRGEHQARIRLRWRTATPQGAYDRGPRRNQASRGAGVAGGRRDRRSRDGAHEGDANVAAHRRDGRPVEAALGPARHSMDPGARGRGGASERDGPNGCGIRGCLARL